MDKNIWLWIIGIAIVIALGMFIQKNYDIFAVVTGTGTMTRTTPSTTVSPSSTFTVTYTTSQGISGRWFVAWSDIVTGGCTPSAVNYFLSSGDPPILTSDSKSFTFTAPTSGSCTFTGYYQYASGSQINFPPLTISVCTDTCTSLGKQCGTWIVCGISKNCGTCGTNQQCNTNGQCITCNTPADTDCNTIVSFQELTTYANQWVAGTVTFTNLIQAATAWVGS